MRIFGLTAAIGAMSVAAAHAEEPAGDWLGVIKTPGGDLTIGLHVKGAPVAYAATLDVVEMGVRGQPLSAVQATGERLAFEVPTVRARYEGAWDATAGAWVGTWTGGGGLATPLRLARGVAPPAAKLEGLDGDWQGTLNMGVAGLLRLVVHVRTGPDGTLATLDSPDQGANGVPISSLRRTGREVEIEIRAIQGKIVAELSQDGGALQGEFTQGPMLTPILLKRTGDGPPTLELGQGAAAPPKTWRVPDDRAIAALLARRIDQERRGVGIAVGVITPAGRRIVAHGAPVAGDTRPVDGDTLFEIGSITKVFTALLLQDMALRGEVGLDDPLAKYLPTEVKVPSRDGKAITLRHLATHTSGLPRDVVPAGAKRMEDMFSAISEAELYRAVAAATLAQDPGTTWAYSNVGMGLLGVALSRRAGRDLESLMRERITAPLGMTATTMGPPPSTTVVARGHDAFLRPAAALTMDPAMAAAGALRSSANEMLNLLAAEMGYGETALAPAMAAMLAEDRPGPPGARQALGWMMLDLPSGRVVSHNGGTFGQRAFTAFNPKTREGVVVLTNAEGLAGADDIGLFLIGGVPVRPLPTAPPPPVAREARAEVPLSPDAAKPYLGRYQLSRSIVLAIGYEKDRLTLVTTAAGRSSPTVPLAFHGGRDFSLAEGQAELTFQPSPAGKAPDLVFRNMVGEFSGRRIAEP